MIQHNVIDELRQHLNTFPTYLHLLFNRLRKVSISLLGCQNGRERWQDYV